MDFYPTTFDKMNVMRSLRLLGEPMLKMINRAINFSNIYHDELNKPEVQQDSDIIKGYSAWKDCKDSLIPMHRFISMTTNVINILQDRVRNIFI